MKYPNFLIRDLLEGVYDENSKKILTKSGYETRRVGVVGYIVFRKEREKFYSLFLNDGTGTIEVRIFDKDLIKEIDFRKPLLVLGRIGEFKNRKYIILDYFSNIDEKIYNYIRVLNIKKLIKLGIKFDISDVKVKEEVKTEEEIEEKEEKLEEEYEIKEEIAKEKRKEEMEIAEIRKEIIRLIKDLDTGEGVEIRKIYDSLKYVKKETIDSVIQELMMSGEIYEPYPGKLKILDVS